LPSPIEEKEILMIGSLMMRVSVVLLLTGLLWGIEVGIRQDFALAPAHAHLNLVGGVLLFAFDLYYRLVPDAGASALAKVRGWLHILGRSLSRLESPSSLPLSEVPVPLPTHRPCGLRGGIAHGTLSPFTPIFAGKLFSWPPRGTL
jgi:hypothetical protein